MNKRIIVALLNLCFAQFVRAESQPRHLDEKVVKEVICDAVVRGNVTGVSFYLVRADSSQPARAELLLRIPPEALKSTRIDMSDKNLGVRVSGDVLWDEDRVRIEGDFNKGGFPVGGPRKLSDVLDAKGYPVLYTPLNIWMSPGDILTLHRQEEAIERKNRKIWRASVFVQVYCTDVSQFRASGH